MGTMTGQLISGFASLLSTVFQNLLQVLKSPAGGIIYALLAAGGDLTENLTWNRDFGVCTYDGFLPCSCRF